MVINGNDFLLVRCQFRRGSLESDENSMILILQPNCGSAQFYGLHSILHLMQPPLGTPHSHITIVLVAKLRKKNRKHDLMQNVESLPEKYHQIEVRFCSWPILLYFTQNFNKSWIYPYRKMTNFTFHSILKLVFTIFPQFPRLFFFAL